MYVLMEKLLKKRICIKTFKKRVFVSAITRKGKKTEKERKIGPRRLLLHFLYHTSPSPSPVLRVEADASWGGKMTLR